MYERGTEADNQLTNNKKIKRNDQDQGPVDNIVLPWGGITPSENLEWHSCYTTENPSFLCARLTVPLDYGKANSSNVTKTAHVHVALLLLPAKRSNTSSLARSPMLINPGGPGGSGVSLALGEASSIQAIFGGDQPIIGFDPRGVAFTTPEADCWATPPACDGCTADAARGLNHRLEWDNMNSGIGSINSSDVALKYLDVGHRAVNQLCRQKNDQLGGNSNSILAHATTADTARDMLAIVDAWDKWVHTNETGSTSAKPRAAKGQLVYYGFSYGTYLGYTFASMFPDRVGRMILDGVIDADLYTSPVWSKSLVDTDKILARFYELCVQVGTECQLYRQGDTARDVRERLDGIMARLEANPVSFTHPDFFFPIVLRASVLKKLLFGVLYSPVAYFPTLALFMNNIYEGRYDTLGVLFQDMQTQCLAPGSPVDGSSTDAQRAIMCGDKVKPVNMTVPELYSSFEALAQTSQFADGWMEIMLQCNGWDIYAAASHNATTPRQSPSWSNDSNTQIQTAFPILFLSSTYDPVTPLYAAVKMSLRFKDAGLIEQKSVGHTASSAVSLCTAKAMREYVLDGKVPPSPAVNGEDYLGGNWTQCEADETPWRPFNGTATGLASLGDGSTSSSAGNVELLKAFKRVQTSLAAFPRWGTAPVGSGPMLRM
ncbi:TAP-like protein-domain-containing protein [Bombardia bombarda]|uniref:TAP-like protein-domain-containing protein n=1 Tax=Bombardia bombarda TaxID=252184 RepID=A0AA40BVV4_9PEZI|nr:TAP-like protein-domain-containing protein [Bombardia bombarda]